MNFFKDFVHHQAENFTGLIFTEDVLNIKIVISKRVRSHILKAVTAGNNETVEFLMNNGADPNIVDRFGHTALDIAEHLGMACIVESLKGSTKRVVFDVTPL